MPTLVFLELGRGALGGGKTHEADGEWHVQAVKCQAYHSLRYVYCIVLCPQVNLEGEHAVNLEGEQANRIRPASKRSILKPESGRKRWGLGF